jgi:hypothetical protein
VNGINTIAVVAKQTCRLVLTETNTEAAMINEVIIRLTGCPGVAGLTKDVVRLTGCLTVTGLHNEVSRLTGCPAVAWLTKDVVRLTGCLTVTGLTNGMSRLTGCIIVAGLTNGVSRLAGSLTVAGLPNEGCRHTDRHLAYTHTVTSVTNEMSCHARESVRVCMIRIQLTEMMHRIHIF